MGYFANELRHSHFQQFWKASLHFCQECNNLLYPKVDQTRNDMVYACRICQYDEKVENQCVYRNDLLTVTKYVHRVDGEDVWADVK